MNPKIMVATAVFGLCCNIVNLLTLGDCDALRGDPEEDKGSGANDINDSIASAEPGEDKKANSNLNVRAAMIHMVGDLIQSIGVIIAGVIILFYPDWIILDPIITFGFSIIVFTTTVDVTKDCYSILMELTPEDIDTE